MWSTRSVRLIARGARAGDRTAQSRETVIKHIVWKTSNLSGGVQVATTALIEITPLATEKLEEMLNEQEGQGTLLRITAVLGPHGGPEYKLVAEKEAKDDDFVVETETIQVLIDAETAPLIEGSQIDYVEDLMRSGFAINNPNFQAGCGCGGGGCGCGGGGCGCGGH